MAKQDNTPRMTFFQLIKLLALPIIFIAVALRHYQFSTHSTPNTLEPSLPLLFDDNAVNQACEIALTKDKKNRIKYLSENVHIALEPRLQDEERYLKRAKVRVKTAFTQLLKSRSTFFANQLDSQGLTLILIPHSLAHDSSSYGVYHHPQRQIGLVYRRDASVSHYRKSLGDEFFHHQLLLHNGESIVESDEMKSALTKAKQRIDHAQLLFQQEAQQATYTHAMQQLLNVASRYPASVYPISKELYASATKLGITTTPDAQGRFFSGPNAPKSKPKFYGVKQDHTIFHTHGRDNTPLGRAEALLGDMAMQLEALDSPDGPYQRMSAERRAINLISFFAQFSAPIQRAFMPEVSNLLCEHYMKSKGAQIY